MRLMPNGGQGVEGHAAGHRRFRGGHNLRFGRRSLGRNRNHSQFDFMGWAMTGQSPLFWPTAVFLGVWALTATGACIWYQAERTHGRRVLIELRKVNALLADLITHEQASKILARVLSGRRA